MNSIKSEIFPQAIYFDTNLLRGLPIHLESADLAELRDFSKRFGFRLLMPQLAVEEYINFRQGEAKEKYNNLIALARYIERLTSKGETLNEILNSTELYKNVKELQSKRFNELGIEIIPTPNLDIHKVCDKFFQNPIIYQGHEGFKDVVILETILNHALNEKFGQIIIVSKDKAFGYSGIINQFASLGIKLEVISDGKNYSDVLFSLVQNIRENVQEFGLQIFTEKQTIIKNSLIRRADEVFRFILENAKIDKFLEVRDFSPLNAVLGEQEEVLPPLSSIEKINNIRFLEIRNVFPELQERVDGRYPIDFSAIVEFNIAISYPKFVKPLWPIAGLLQNPEYMNVVSHTETTVEERTVNRTFYIQASVEKKDAAEMNFKEIVFEKTY